MSTTNATEFVVQTATANMPNSCWGRYIRVAVLEVEKGTAPKMISSRAHGVVRVVRTWEKCHDGGPRSASARAIAEARELAASLNAGEAS